MSEANFGETTDSGEGWHILRLMDAGQEFNFCNGKGEGTSTYLQEFHQHFIYRGRGGHKKAMDFQVGILEKELLSTDEEQVALTKRWINYWNFHRPEQPHFNLEGYNPFWREDQFNPLVLDVSSTMSRVDHVINVNVSSDVVVRMNSSGYRQFMTQLRDIDPEKDYSELVTSPWFKAVMPSELIKILKNYDWEQHKGQMYEGYKERSKGLRKNFTGKDSPIIVHPDNF